MDKFQKGFMACLEKMHIKNENCDDVTNLYVVSVLQTYTTANSH